MDSTRPVRILSLDGSGPGIRGISSLFILQHVMSRLGKDVRPCECFDLIVGSGTGAISAVFLGCLGMTPDDAIREYIKLAEVVFRRPSLGGVGVFFRRILQPDQLLDSSVLERHLADVFKRFSDVRSRNQPHSSATAAVTYCRTAVLATRAHVTDSPPHLFRLYPDSGAISDTSTICKITSASAAMAGFAHPVAVGDPPILYVDPGVAGFSNPSEVGIDEAHKLWPESQKCVVSLGTGLGDIVSTNGTVSAFSKACMHILQNCETVHDRALRRCEQNPEEKTQYLRLNVVRGLRTFDIVTSNGYASLEKLAGITEGYVASAEARKEVTECVQALKTSLDYAAPPIMPMPEFGKGNIPHSSAPISEQEGLHTKNDDATFSLALQPFSKNSGLCLDGKIIRRSEYMVVSGGYADIWTGILGCRTVAIKTMRSFSSIGALIEKDRLFKRLWREYVTWSCLRHPNILDCLGFSYDFTSSEREIPSLISPWMPNGTVLTYIEKYPTIDRLNLMIGVAEGLAYLHGREPAIIHGDIRAGNILVSDEGIPCLADFGLSRILGDARGMTTSSDVAGSLRWMSPELLHGERATESSDVWAFGMTLLEILSGKRPYHDINLEVVVLRSIIDGSIPSRPVLDPWSHSMTDQLWEIFRRCWHFEASGRPSMRDITRDLIAQQPDSNNCISKT